MKYLTLRSVAQFTLGTLLAASALAQTPSSQVKQRFTTVTQAVEAVAGTVVLPSSPSGTLVMKTCFECVPKSFQVIASTSFFVDEVPATLAELRAAVAEAPSHILTVSYVLETGVVTQVSAVR